MYGEVHLALSNKSFIVATTGMRTLIELVCKNLNPNSKSLRGKINGLVTMQKLTLKNADNLHKLTDFGNDAVHDAKIPSEEILNRCIHIIERLLEDLYSLNFELKKI